MNATLNTLQKYYKFNQAEMQIIEHGFDDDELNNYAEELSIKYNVNIYQIRAVFFEVGIENAYDDAESLVAIMTENQ